MHKQLNHPADLMFVFIHALLYLFLLCLVHNRKSGSTFLASRRPTGPRRSRPRSRNCTNMSRLTRSQTRWRNVSAARSHVTCARQISNQVATCPDFLRISSAPSATITTVSSTTLPWSTSVLPLSTLSSASVMPSSASKRWSTCLVRPQYNTHCACHAITQWLTKPHLLICLIS